MQNHLICYCFYARFFISKARKSEERVMKSEEKRGKGNEKRGKARKWGRKLAYLLIFLYFCIGFKGKGERCV